MSTNLTSKNGTIWTSIGKLIYLLGWPAIFLIISLSPERSRVLVLSEGQLLLTKDWIGRGKWSIPGGGLHVNEDPVTGALRELREETGLKLRPSDLNKLGSLKLKNNGIKTHLIIFNAEYLKKPRITISGIEIIDFVWADKTTLEKLKIDANTSKIINSFPSVSNLIQ